LEGIRSFEMTTRLENEAVIAKAKDPQSDPERFSHDEARTKEWLNSVMIPQNWSDLALDQ